MSAPVEGAWALESYNVGGRTTAIDGILLLAAGSWCTLYFVPGEGGEWGSAEAGRYEYGEGCITFRHRLRFQGGGRRPLEMGRDVQVVETCEVDTAAGLLTIRFPSGNEIRGRRLVDEHARI